MATHSQVDGGLIERFICHFIENVVGVGLSFVPLIASGCLQSPRLVTNPLINSSPTSGLALAVGRQASFISDLSSAVAKQFHLVPSDVDSFAGWSDADVLQVFCGTYPLHDWASDNCSLAIVMLEFGRGPLAQPMVLTFIFKRTQTHRKFAFKMLSRSFRCLYSQSSKDDPFDHKIGHCAS